MSVTTDPSPDRFAAPLPAMSPDDILHAAEVCFLRLLDGGRWHSIQLLGSELAAPLVEAWARHHADPDAPETAPWPERERLRRARANLTCTVMREMALAGKVQHRVFDGEDEFRLALPEGPPPPPPDPFLESLLPDELVPHELTAPPGSPEAASCEGLRRCSEGPDVTHAAGVQPRPGGTLDALLREDLAHRHLSTSQRSLIAARLTLSSRTPARDRALEALAVPARTLDAGRRVLRWGCAELVEAVASGQVSVTAAAALAALPPEEQAGVVRQGRKEVARRARELRQRRKVAAETA